MQNALHRVLTDWLSVIGRPSRGQRDQRLSEFPVLIRSLDVAPEKIEVPPDVFGAIGDAVPLLTNEEFASLVPALVYYAYSSDEPTFARCVVDRLISMLPALQGWAPIAQELSPETREWMYSFSRLCCHLGWDDERRRERRLQDCRKIFEWNDRRWP